MARLWPGDPLAWIPPSWILGRGGRREREGRERLQWPTGRSLIGGAWETRRAKGELRPRPPLSRWPPGPEHQWVGLRGGAWEWAGPGSARSAGSAGRGDCQSSRVRADLPAGGFLLLLRLSQGGLWPQPVINQDWKKGWFLT